jgi:CheY-like chemotaxis protein
MRKTTANIVGMNCQVVDVASDGREAVNAVLRHRPDVILTDVLMPDLDGIQVSKHLYKLEQQLQSRDCYHPGRSGLYKRQLFRKARQVTFSNARSSVIFLLQSVK